MDSDVIFLIILPIVAFLYAAVGHGGASGYLALMALFSFPVEIMKPTALLLNLFVAAISFYHFRKEGHFKLKLFLAFALASVPLSFVGGLIEVDVKTYKIILGLLLIFAIAKILGLFGKQSDEIRKVNWPEGLTTGGIIGFFSGLIGIGGGIILSPVILLFRWGNVKEAAAVSALFIWVNSASGLIGQFMAGARIDNNSWLMVLLAVTGGYIGGVWGSKGLKNTELKYLLALVLVLASLKLLFV